MQYLLLATNTNNSSPSHVSSRIIRATRDGKQQIHTKHPHNTGVPTLSQHANTNTHQEESNKEIELDIELYENPSAYFKKYKMLPPPRPLKKRRHSGVSSASFVNHSLDYQMEDGKVLKFFGNPLPDSAYRQSKW